MEITIKKNDSFCELIKITGKSSIDLQDKIIKGLKSTGLLQEHSKDVGKTLKELVESRTDQTVEQIVSSVFENLKVYDNLELFSFFEGITFWGDGYEMVCDECGCEMESEDDSCWGQNWTNWNCSNIDCENTINNSPDWDSMPGGFDF